MGLIFILYFSLGTCKDKDKPSSFSVLETLNCTLTAYQNKLEDTSNEVTLALFGSICIAFSLQQYIRFACNKGQKRGNVELTASHIRKEIASVTTISLSLPYGKVSLIFGGTGKRVFFPTFFFFFNFLGLLFSIIIHGNRSSISRISVKRRQDVRVRAVYTTVLLNTT